MATKHLQIRMEPEDHARFVRTADARGLKQNDAAKEAVLAWMKGGAGPPEWEMNEEETALLYGLLAYIRDDRRNEDTMDQLERLSKKYSKKSGA